jgi:hypothetical protein
MANYNVNVQDHLETTELVRSRYLRNGASGIYQARVTRNQFIHTTGFFDRTAIKVPINCSSTSTSTTALETLPNVARVQLWDFTVENVVDDDFTTTSFVDDRTLGRGMDIATHTSWNDDLVSEGGEQWFSDASPYEGTYFPDNDGPVFFPDLGIPPNRVYNLQIATDGATGSAPFWGSGTYFKTALFRIDLGAYVNFPGDAQNGSPFGRSETPPPHPSGTIFFEDSVTSSDNLVTIHRDYSFGIVPHLDIYEWDLAETSPSGQRHVPSGAFAWENFINTKGYLDFGTSNQSTNLSNTRCISFKVHKEVVPFGVTNCKLWVSQASGLGVYPTNISVNYLNSNIWNEDYSLASGVGTLLKSALPAHQNIFRNDSSIYIDGGTLDQYNFPDTDQNTSQYMYMSVNHNPALLPNGIYGFGGAGALKLRITFDYFAWGYYWSHKW